jgi:Lar family restriction alleviation protein
VALRPCPLCGERRALLVLDDPQAEDWRVECAACRLTLRADSLADLLTRWNRRAPEAADA